ncbi:MAG: DNA polymerase III subunit gamma/tau, partial [Methylocystis sp.]
MDHEQNASKLTPARAADKSVQRQSGEASHAPYRVLARKYRPTTFVDLIGQQSLVRTLENAFELGRIHQAYLLTGVRGVGKTTTARILARAFN